MDSEHRMAVDITGLIIAGIVIIITVLTMYNAHQVSKQAKVDKAAIAQGLCQRFRGIGYPTYTWEACK